MLQGVLAATSSVAMGRGVGEGDVKVGRVVL
jgi:hypothetical protein